MEPFQENILSIGGANAVAMHDEGVSCVYHLCLCGVKSMGPLLSAQPWPPVGGALQEFPSTLDRQIQWNPLSKDHMNSLGIHGKQVG